MQYQIVQFLHSLKGMIAGLFLTLSIFYGPASASDQVIVALGDSLTAGYGLEQGKGFAPQLERWLTGRGHAVRVMDAGVSGDTSSGGLSRLSWVLAGAGGDPDLVIVELGANDLLRGVDPAVTRDNMDSILGRLADRDIPVLLAGMRATPSMGPDYVAAFDSIFTDMAEKYDVAFYPFFLEGVAGIPALNLSDGVHPTAEGVSVIVDRIGPMVEEALD